MNCPSCGRPLDDSSRFCKFCGAATQAAEPEDPSFSKVHAGDVFEGKWRIEAKLGQGGMGAVFLAHDVSLDRKVAIKILAGELCNDEEFVVRFEREAKLTANLEHPNIVPVYAVGKFGVRPFIVMKLLEGAPLSKLLREHPDGLPVEEVLVLMRQICDGLGFIHSKGFVHRDIKAGNIIVSPTGHATILDFGILRDTKESEGLTRAGVMMGTPHYMSPEQARGKTIDPRADLYALGCLIYELLVGKLPFLADNDFEIIAAHVKSPPPDPRKAKASLPEGLTGVIRKALAKDPAERFQTAAELFTSLEAALKPAPVRRQTRAVAVAAAAPATPAAGRTPTTGRRGAFTHGVGDDNARPTPPPAKRATRPSQRIKAPVDDTTDQLPPAPVDDSAPTPPRMQRPQPAPQPKPEVKAQPEPAKKSGGGLAALLVVVALGGLGALTYKALQDGKAETQEVSTELQPIVPTEETGEGPPPHLAAAAQPAEPVAVEPTEPTPDTPAPAAADQAPAPQEPAATAPAQRPARQRTTPAKAASTGEVTKKADTTAALAGAGEVGSLRVVTTQGGEAVWATLSVDGKRKGDTPLTFDLAPGSHSVVIERGGFKRIEKQVSVTPGDVTVVKLELEKDGG